MRYLVDKTVKQLFHDNGKQISKCGLLALDIFIESKLERLAKLHNGGHKRIDEKIVKLFLK